MPVNNRPCPAIYFKTAMEKSRCSATRRSGFSQGKYKGNGSSLVICFKGAEPLRRACSANGPISRPAAARLSCRLSMGYVFSISDRPTKSFSICTSQKGRVPFLFGTRLENHPAIRGAVLSSTFLSTSMAETACSTPNRYRRALRWPRYCVCHRSCLWDAYNALDVFFRFIPDGLCLNTESCMVLTAWLMVFMKIRISFTMIRFLFLGLSSFSARSRSMYWSVCCTFKCCARMASSTFPRNSMSSSRSKARAWRSVNPFSLIFCVLLALNAKAQFIRQSGLAFS